MTDHVTARPIGGTLECRRYPTLSKALAMHLDEDHRYIYTKKEELAERNNIDELKFIWKCLMPNSPVPQWKSRTGAAEQLWPILLARSVYIDPWGKGVEKGRSRRISKSLSGRSYILLSPGMDDWPEDQQRGLYEIPQQAKDIIYYLNERAIDRGSATWMEPEMKQVMVEMEKEKRLRTRQDPWRIFQYYRSKLIKYGFIKMEAAK